MHPLQTRWFLKKADLLQQLSPEEIDLLNQHSERILKKRGELVWLNNQSTPKVYVVDQGFIRVCRISCEGKRLILSILGPAEFFGFVSPDLAPLDENDSVEVIRDARLIAIDAAIFHLTVKSHPDMALCVVKILEGRKRALENRLSSLLFKDVYARTAELLLDLNSRYGEECPWAPGTYRDLSLTHQELADMIGAARPTVSNIMSEFIKADLIHKHKQYLSGVTQGRLN